MMSDRHSDKDKEPAEGSRETVNQALQSEGAQQGVSNRPLQEERRQQEKLPPRGESEQDDHAGSGPGGVANQPEALASPGTQSSAGKTGTRSGARKQASASRGGKEPGKARAKAGASGMANRRPASTVRAAGEAPARAAAEASRNDTTKSETPASRRQSRRRVA